jgi:nicotinate-nucleotide adenylyltransferase
MKFIGILGGTFNPIHYGHLRIAQEVAETLGLCNVKFIPSANPPHKAPPRVTAQQRAEMVTLSIEDNPLFSLDTQELARTGPSYTIDTLKSLHAENPDATFCLIMGMDAFAHFDLWHEWQAILNYCHLILVPRTHVQVQLAQAQPTLSPALTSLLQKHAAPNIQSLSQQKQGYIIQLPVTVLDISSSQIRELIRQKKQPIYLTPQAVMTYIYQHQLYQAEI